MKKLTVRVTEQELQEWRDAAWLRKVSLSEWVRKVLTATAQETKGGKGG
jgi:predicted HicB family RNase H-like nuclease